MSPDFIIKENSLVAKIAARTLRSPAAAMVLGKTIHLHNISKEHFLQNERLLRHELCHIAQYRRHGYIGFVIKYLLESARRGYHNNKFEVEARKAELL